MKPFYAAPMKKGNVGLLIKKVIQEARQIQKALSTGHYTRAVWNMTDGLTHSVFDCQDEVVRLATNGKFHFERFLAKEIDQFLSDDGKFILHLLDAIDQIMQEMEASISMQPASHPSPSNPALRKVVAIHPPSQDQVWGWAERLGIHATDLEERQSRLSRFTRRNLVSKSGQELLPKAQKEMGPPRKYDRQKDQALGLLWIYCWQKGLFRKKVELDNYLGIQRGEVEASHGRYRKARVEIDPEQVPRQELPYLFRGIPNLHLALKLFEEKEKE